MCDICEDDLDHLEIELEQVKSERDRLRAELEQVKAERDVNHRDMEGWAFLEKRAREERDEARAALENLRQEHLHLKSRSLETLTERDYAKAEARRLRKALQDTRDFLDDCASDPGDDKHFGFSDAVKAIDEALKTEHNASR